MGDLELSNQQYSNSIGSWVDKNVVKNPFINPVGAVGSKNKTLKQVSGKEKSQVPADANMLINQQPKKESAKEDVIENNNDTQEEILGIKKTYFITGVVIIGAGVLFGLYKLLKK